MQASTPWTYEATALANPRGCPKTLKARPRTQTPRVRPRLQRASRPHADSARKALLVQVYTLQAVHYSTSQ